MKAALTKLAEILVSSAVFAVFSVALLHYFFGGQTENNDRVVKVCAGYFSLKAVGADDQTIGAWALAHPECLATLNKANGDAK